MEAKDLAVIQGPPGTGKSTAIAELIWQLALANPKDRTLLTSEANLAVDNALDRLKFSDHNIVNLLELELVINFHQKVCHTPSPR